MSLRNDPALYLAMGTRFIAKEISIALSKLTGRACYLAPGLVDIHLTFRCNLRCQQCQMWAKDAQKDELSTGEWKNIILDIRKTVGPYFLRFYGGEPFMRHDLLELLAFCRKNNVVPLLTTNATLIDRAMARELERFKLASVQISVDGARAQTHDTLRGMPGTYEKVMAAISHMKGRIPLQINTTVIENNLDEILELADWAGKNSIPISFQGLIVLGWNYKKEGFRRHHLFPKDQDKAYAVLDELCAKKKNNPCMINSLLHLQRLRDYYKNPESLSKKACEALSHHLVVRVNGDAWPCTFFGKIGNLKQDSLRNIWNSPQTRAKLLQMRGCQVTNCLIMRGCSRESWGEIWHKAKRSLLAPR